MQDQDPAGTAVDVLRQSMVVAADETLAARLTALGEAARSEFRQGQEHAAAAVKHAIASGHALAEAKALCPRERWISWVADNFEASYDTAHRYIRLASYREVPGVKEADSVKGALRVLAGLPDPTAKRAGYKAEMKETALEMRAQGMTQREVARALSVTDTTIANWTDPQLARRRNERSQLAMRRIRAQKSAEQAALRVKEREDAVRARGGSVSKAYGLVRRAELEVAAARSQVESREARQALDAAIHAIHRAEDEIGKASKLP